MTEAARKLRVTPSDRKETVSDADKLKIAFWFIDKCGGIEAAERIVRAAAAALRSLVGDDTAS